MIFLPIVQGELGVLEELARKFVAAQAAQHVLYTEVRYSPHILTRNATYGHLEAAEDGRPSCTARDVVDAVTAGLRRGCAEHAGTDVRQILCMIDGRPEFCSDLVEIAAERAVTADGPCGIVGVD
eukprot:1819657-Prymnesium_polylepis.1